MGIIDYINETRSELRHVAWPTRLQTILYTIIVMTLSIAVALYLGFFDFIFTTGLGRVVDVLPHTSNSTAGQGLSTSTSNNSLIISTSTGSTGSPQAPKKIPSNPGEPSFQ